MPWNYSPLEYDAVEELDRCFGLGLLLRMSQLQLAVSGLTLWWCSLHSFPWLQTGSLSIYVYNLGLPFKGELVGWPEMKRRRPSKNLSASESSILLGFNTILLPSSDATKPLTYSTESEHFWGLFLTSTGHSLAERSWLICGEITPSGLLC